MSTYIVTPSTSVVLIDTASLAAGEFAIVLLSSLTPPGRNVTIRDSLGYLSTPQSIIISTTQNVLFADGTSSIKTSHPFTTLSFVSRDANTWNIINTFGFPLYDTVANVNSLTASTINGTSLQLSGTISANTIVANSMYLRSSSQILGSVFVSTLVVGTQDANIVTPYTAYVVGSSYISSNAVIGGNLNVGGVSEFKSSITVGGSLSVTNGLAISGDITVQGNMLTLGPGQLQCGSANIQSSLTVLGSAIFNSNVAINSNLTVVGTTNTNILNTSTTNINVGGYLQLGTGPILQARTDIVPGQITASWNSPLYTPYLSTNTIQTTTTNVSNLNIGNTISAPTLSQFIMSSAAIVNPAGSLTLNTLTANTLTLSNTFIASNLNVSSILVSSMIAQTSITCTNPQGFISSAALYTSSIQASAINTGSITANVIQTPAVSVSSLTVAQSITGGPAFSTFNIPQARIQNENGSIITRSLFTTALSVSSLNMTSGRIETTNNLSINAPNIFMNSLTVSSIVASTLRVSSINARQITIGSPVIPFTNGPTLSPVSVSSITVTGGPGDYLTPYFLSNVKPAGQNPLIAYTPTANYITQYNGVLPPGLQIAYTATLFWAGQSASILNIGNGAAVLYGTYNSDQTITGTLTQSTFQLQASLYGNSAFNVTFGYQYSPNVNSIDPNSVIDFNNGILRWNYALNGTTIQNSLNDISTRNLFYYGGLQFASDPRIKENVTDANLKKCYDTIESIPLRRYKYIDSYCSTFQVKDTYRLGLLATDLLPHFPKSVHASDIFPEFSTSLLTIDTSQLEMAHLGATKYLIEEVNHLEKILIERLGKKMPWAT